MRLDSPVVAFPAWLGGRLPKSRLQGNAREGVPLSRGPVAPGSVRERRLKLGLTLAAVADLLGIHEQTLRRLEARFSRRGERVDVRVRRVRARVNDLYLSIERERGLK